MSDTERTIRILFISLLVSYLINLTLSIILLKNKGGYGYNGILSMLEDNPIVLDMNKKECEKYISDIQYNKEFAKVKTLYILIFNIGVIIYIILL